MRKILLPTIFLLLGYGIWVSPEFKTITAGVAIFLFGMLTTSVMQSSSLVSVITISFLSAGLI